MTAYDIGVFCLACWAIVATFSAWVMALEARHYKREADDADETSDAWERRCLAAENARNEALEQIQRMTTWRQSTSEESSLPTLRA